MDNEFLHDLLTAMIKQHGADTVGTRLTQLHAKMSIPKQAPEQERICNSCGGSKGSLSSAHYCM